MGKVEERRTLLVPSKLPPGIWEKTACPLGGPWSLVTKLLPLHIRACEVGVIPGWPAVGELIAGMLLRSPLVLVRLGLL